MESNHAPPPYQSGAYPVGLPSRLVRKRDSAERNPALGSPPPAGHIPEGVGFAAATAELTSRCISPGGFEPPSSSLASWCSCPLSYDESSALGGSRTRLTRETAEPRHQARPRACAAAKRQLRPRSGRLQGSSRARAAGAVLALRKEWSPGESNPARVVASHHPGHQEPHESDRRESNPVCGAGNAVCFRPDTTVACGAPRAGFEPASPV